MNRHNIVPFGTTPAGETAHKIHLQNQDVSCDTLTYGTTLQSLVVPDRTALPSVYGRSLALVTHL